MGTGMSEHRAKSIESFLRPAETLVWSDTPAHVAGISAAANMSRIHGLNDGRRQLCVVSRWPEASTELQQAVEAIVDSIRVG